MKIAKQIIGFLLALSLPLVLIACGDGTDTPKSGGSKRQYDDSIPAELEGDKYNLHNYSLETADGIYYYGIMESVGLSIFSHLELGKISRLCNSRLTG